MGKCHLTKRGKQTGVALTRLCCSVEPSETVPIIYVGLADDMAVDKIGRTLIRYKVSLIILIGEIFLWPSIKSEDLIK